MIKNLYVKNFVLIDELNLDFQNAFSCFTGETGAGKSLLIDAISILCGARVSSSAIQKGCNKARIEALITLNAEHPAYQQLIEAGYEIEEDAFILSREFSHDGKSFARINQRMSTLSFVKSIMDQIVDIHSQHDTQYLLHNKYHLSLLDEFSNEKERVTNVNQCYDAYQQEINKLAVFMKEEANPDDLDYLRYQLAEIEDVNILENEIEILEKKQKEMAMYEKTASKLEEACRKLEASNYELLYDVSKLLESMEVDEIQIIGEEITNAYYSIEEQVGHLKQYVDNMEYNEEEYDAIQARLFQIHKILRKHGGTYANLLQQINLIKEKIAFIEGRSTFIKEQEDKIEQCKQHFMVEAMELSKLRKNAALLLEKEIQKELSELYLPNARFKIHFNKNINRNGCDRVQFTVAMNVGEDLKPLAKVASGGELSRLMLGLKTIFNRLQKIQTIIFDEIDNGVSGNVAYAIGKKMNVLGKSAQVFSVTHLAPVAAWSNAHYLVKKDERDGKTFSDVVLLDRKKIIEELSSISQGSTSEQSLLAAQELYDSCMR